MHSFDPRDTYLAPGRPAWALLLSVFVADGLWLTESDFTLAWGEAGLISLFAGALLAVGCVYTRLRPSPALASAATATAYLVLFTAAGALLSYVTAGAALPLRDHAFIAADRALGFDWRGHVTWMTEHPVLLHLLNLAYNSMQAQICGAILVLAIVDRRALSEFITLYAITASVTVIVAVAVPAVGAYVVTPLPTETLARLPDELTGRSQVAHFLAVREGALRHVSLFEAQGLVAFPSFHTALAIILARALLRVRGLAVPGLVLNGLVLVSTLSIGGHYLADVIGGSALTLLAIAWIGARKRAAPGRPGARDSASLGPGATPGGSQAAPAGRCGHCGDAA